MDEYIVLAASDGRVLAETTFQMLQLGKDLGEALVRIVKAESPPSPADWQGGTIPHMTRDVVRQVKPRWADSSGA